MDVLKSGIGWAWTIFSGLFAIFLFTQHWQAGLVLAASGIVTLPPLTPCIKRVHGEHGSLRTAIRFIMAVVLFIKALSVNDALTTPQERAAEATREKHEAEVAAREKAQNDAQAKRDADAAAERDAESWAFSQCETAVKGRLRDPDSAEFPTDYAAWDKAQRGPGATGTVYTAFVKVRGANGFGGKTVSVFTCTILKSSGDDWPVLDIQELNADQLAR